MGVPVTICLDPGEFMLAESCLSWPPTSICSIIFLSALILTKTLIIIPSSLSPVPPYACLLLLLFIPPIVAIFTHFSRHHLSANDLDLLPGSWLSLGPPLDCPVVHVGVLPIEILPVEPLSQILPESPDPPGGSSPTTLKLPLAINGPSLIVAYSYSPLCGFSSECLYLNSRAISYFCPSSSPIKPSARCDPGSPLPCWPHDLLS